MMRDFCVFVKAFPVFQVSAWAASANKQEANLFLRSEASVQLLGPIGKLYLKRWRSSVVLPGVSVITKG